MPDDKQSEIDDQLISLIRRRVELIAADSKAGVPVSVSTDNRNFEKKVREICGDDDPALVAVMRHVGSYCRRRVSSGSISFLGPEYSYSHLAAMKYFGEGASFAPVASIPAVFDAVHRGDASSGLVPIENSTDGRVVDTLGMFVRRHMQICGEVLLPIHHNLLASGDRDQIKEVHSKPQALSQCREWLAANFPLAELVEVGSTTAAAESASNDPTIAAVASLPAGRVYGLDAMYTNIEDNPDNVTRFAVLGKDQTTPTGADKTSILFQVAHQPGSLASVMNVFSEAKLNLTWIESFPSPDARNEYLFFVELRGHRDDEAVADAIKTLQDSTHRLDVLGSYPVATL